MISRLIKKLFTCGSIWMKTMVSHMDKCKNILGQALRSRFRSKWNIHLLIQMQLHVLLWILHLEERMEFWEHPVFDMPSVLEEGATVAAWYIAPKLCVLRVELTCNGQVTRLGPSGVTFAKSIHDIDSILVTVIKGYTERNTGPVALIINANFATRLSIPFHYYYYYSYEHEVGPIIVQGVWLCSKPCFSGVMKVLCKS